MTDNELAFIDKGCAELERAKTIGDTVDLRDKAWAVERYAKKRAGCERAELLARGMRLRAERQIGQMSARLAKGPTGTSSPRHRLHNPTSPNTGKVDTGKCAALEAAGVSVPRAYEYEAIAAIPEEQFEEQVVKPTATTQKLIAQGRAIKRETESAKPRKRKKKGKKVHRADARYEWALGIVRACNGFKNKPMSRVTETVLNRIQKDASYLAELVKQEACRGQILGDPK